MSRCLGDACASDGARKEAGDLMFSCHDPFMELAWARNFRGTPIHTRKDPIYRVRTAADDFLRRGNRQ